MLSLKSYQKSAVALRLTSAKETRRCLESRICFAVPMENGWVQCQYVPVSLESNLDVCLFLVYVYLGRHSRDVACFSSFPHSAQPDAAFSA